MQYHTSNGVKPRFDNSGTEFGLMHRDLGRGYSMFDIDRMTAQLDMQIEMRRENEGFIEYRRTAGNINFVALMEVKHRRTKYSEQALDPTEANSMVRLEMARRLGCRLFVVFATNGKQPFDFYEICADTGEAKHAGTLDYTSDRVHKCRLFWNNILGIQRTEFE